MFFSRFLQTTNVGIGGFTITPFTLPTTAYWNKVVYGAGKYVAISGGYSDRVHNYGAYSTDGLTWVAMTLPANAPWSGLAWNGTMFVATCGAWATMSTQYATSTDGINWTSRTFPISNGWQAVAWNGSYWCTNNGDISYRGVMNSPDGLTWTGRTFTNGGTTYTTGIYALGTKFVQTCNTQGNAASTYYLASTDNGNTWTTYATGIASGVWNNGCSSGSAVLAVGFNSNKTALTTDALSWTYGTLPFAAASGACAYFNSKFFAGQSNSPNFAYSSNGITWALFTNTITTTQIGLMGAGPNGVICIAGQPTNQGFRIS